MQSNFSWCYFQMLLLLFLTSHQLPPRGMAASVFLLSNPNTVPMVVEAPRSEPGTGKTSPTAHLRISPVDELGLSSDAPKTVKNKPGFPDEDTASISSADVAKKLVQPQQPTATLIVKHLPKFLSPLVAERFFRARGAATTRLSANGVDITATVWFRTIAMAEATMTELNFKKSIVLPTVPDEGSQEVQIDGCLEVVYAKPNEAPPPQQLTGWRQPPVARVAVHPPAPAVPSHPMPPGYTLVPVSYQRPQFAAPAHMMPGMQYASAAPVHHPVVLPQPVAQLPPTMSYVQFVPAPGYAPQPMYAPPPQPSSYTVYALPPSYQMQLARSC